MNTGLLKKLKIFIFEEIETQHLSLFQSILLFLFCILELTLILLFVPISFAGNDDTAMNAIASGAMTGKPSEFLLFSNIIIGHILSFLFSTTTNINWYTWYLITTFALGYASIQYFFFKYTTGILEKVVVHLIILMFLYPSLLGIQFTKIAAISLAGGFILIFSSSKGKEYLYITLGIILVIMGTLIRKEVFYMYLLLTAPFLFAYLVNKNKKFGFSVIALIIAFSAIAYDYHQYSNNQAFEKYRVFNTLRSSITSDDNPSFTFEANKSILNDVGWNFVDYNVASNFNIDVGHPKFSNTTLTKIAKNINNPSRLTNTSNLYLKIKYTILSVADYFKSHFHYLLVFIIILILSLKGNRTRTIILSTYIVYIFGVAWMLSLYLNGALKERVIWSLVLPLFLLSVFFVFNDTKNVGINVFLTHWKKKIFYGVLIFISLSVIARYTRGSIILNDESRLASDKAIASFLSKQPLDFYVSWCELAKYNPFDLPYSNKNQYSLGWLAGSPFNNEKIKRYTGRDNIGVYTIYNKDIVWFFRNNFFYKNFKFQDKVCAFYLSNNEYTKIKFETIPINNKDTVYKYTFFIPINKKEPFVN